MKKYKKIIICLLLSISITSMSFLKPKEVYAFDLVITPTVLAYLFGTALISSGVVLYHKNDIINFGNLAYQEFEKQSEEVKSKIVQFKPDPLGGGGRFKLGALAFGFVGSVLDTLKSSDTVTSGNYEKYSFEHVYNLRDGEYPNIAFSTPNDVFASLYSSFPSGSRLLDVSSIYTVVKTDKAYIKVIQNGVSSCYWYSTDGNNLYVKTDAQVVRQPVEVLHTYDSSNLNSEIISSIATPSVATSSDLNLDELVNTDFDNIKEKVTETETPTDPEDKPIIGWDLWDKIKEMFDNDKVEPSDPTVDSIKNKVDGAFNNSKFRNTFTKIEKMNTSIEMLDAKIEGLYREVEETNSKVNKTKDNIEKTQEEIVQAQQEIEEEQTLFDKRMRSMYINGVASTYVEVLLDSDGISEFIDNIELLRNIAEYDKEIIAGLKEKKAEIEKKKQKLEEEKANLLVLKASQEKKLEEVKSSKDEQQQLIAELERERQIYASRISDYDKKIKESQKEIQILIFKILVVEILAQQMFNGLLGKRELF